FGIGCFLFIECGNLIVYIRDLSTKLVCFGVDLLTFEFGGLNFEAQTEFKKIIHGLCTTFEQINQNEEQKA
ncbi:MAG TPA: hypothetical protein P5229_04885, partial [Candidatus Gracilibacteria bacterium]|nr:hypothetical protein [Candidatus Gracilibacteria bacterium]